MAAKGITLDAVHLDYCACVSDVMLTELGHIAACPVVRPRGAIAVTALRGRESGPVKERFDVAHEYDHLQEPFHEWEYSKRGPDTALWDGGPSGLTPTWRDAYRAMAVADALTAGAGAEWYSGDAWRVYHYGAYRSGAGGQTMWWAVLATDPDRYRRRPRDHGPGHMYSSEGWQWSGDKKHDRLRVNGYEAAETMEEHRNEMQRRMEWINATGDDAPNAVAMLLRKYRKEELATLPDSEWLSLRGIGPHRLRCIRDNLAEMSPL